MSKSFKVIPFVKFGLMDATGKVVVKEATFDEVLVSAFWVVVKEKGEWRDLSDLIGEKPVSGSFKEAELFDDVLWFKKNDKWGAMDSTRTLVVPMDYWIISKMENSSVMVLAKSTDEVEYFTVKGKKILPSGVEKFQIEDFYLGYAMARGYDKKTGADKFFVVCEDGRVFLQEFTSMKECRNFLKDLQDDYVWTVNAFR